MNLSLGKGEPLRVFDHPVQGRRRGSGRKVRSNARRGREALLTIERSLIRHVVHEQNTHGAAVIRRRDGAKALLAGRVPYLQLHSLAVELDGTDLEIDADGGDEGRCEGVLAKAQQAARLADAGVADQKEFDLQGARYRERGLILRTSGTCHLGQHGWAGGWVVGGPR